MNQLKIIDFAESVTPESPETENGRDFVYEDHPAPSSSAGTELIVLDANSIALTALTTENGLDPIIEKIRQQAKSEVFDVTTKEGRVRIGSVARQIGSAKEKIKKVAKSVIEDQEKTVKQVKAEIKRMETEMDAIRDEVLADRDKYEQIEKDRVAAHEDALELIEAFQEFNTIERTTEEIQKAIEASAAFYASRDWQEFNRTALYWHDKNARDLTVAFQRRREYDDGQAALAKQRAEEEARKQKERDDEIAAQAAAKAKADAEAKAKEEADAIARKVEEEKAEAARIAKEVADLAEAQRVRLENEKKEADARAAKAEADRIAAEAKARSDAEAAAQKVRDDLAAQQKAESEAKAKREADVAHARKINNEALEDIRRVIHESVGSEDPMKDLVVAIAKGEIRHVSIRY